MSLTLEGEYQRGHWYMPCGWCHLPWRENIGGDIDTRLVVDMSLTLEGEYQRGHWYMTCGWYVTYPGGRISMGTLIQDLWLICHLLWRENINGDIDTWLVVDVTYPGGRISVGTLIHDLWLICHLLWRENISRDIDTRLVVDMSLTLEGEYQWGHWHMTCGWCHLLWRENINGDIDTWLVVDLPWRENISGDIDTWLVVDMRLFELFTRSHIHEKQWHFVTNHRVNLLHQHARCDANKKTKCKSTGLDYVHCWHIIQNNNNSFTKLATATRDKYKSTLTTWNSKRIWHCQMR